MRILVIGQNYVAKAFANCLASNVSDLVFTNQEGTFANFVGNENLGISELKDFALANEIDLTILCDTETVSGNLIKIFEESELAVFAPDVESARIAVSRANAKRFMYKNKFQTPRFGIFDKIQLALDWARGQNVPLIVNSDIQKNSFESVFCKTFPKAKKAIEGFFETDLKQIVIENALEGEDFSLYVISDGYNIVPLGFCKHEENLSFLEAAMDSQKREQALNIARRTISSLARDKKNYVGILGIDFKIDPKGNLWTLDYNPFFKEIDADLFAYSITENKIALMNSAITGTLLDDFKQIEKSPLNFASAKKDGEFYCVYGRTLNEAKYRLNEVLEGEEISCTD